MAALIRIGTKFGIAGGAIYLTLNEGIWSSSGSVGSKALEKVRTNVLPAANDMLEKVPSCDCVSDKIKSSWNQGVKATFSTVAESPQLLVKYGSQGVEYVREKTK